MDLLKDYPYRMILASQIKPLVSEEKDVYLAKASLSELKKFIPTELVGDKIDLLPFAANGFNVNRANKNQDAIDTSIAMGLYKDFIYKYIDVEHTRNRVIGVILSSELSEFGTSKLLTASDIKDYKEYKPFNVAIGGVIWRLVNPKLAELIEEGSDPDSEKYMAWSLSWELGFKDYNIAVLKDESPNIEGADIITGEEVDKYKKYLTAFGGSGVIDGRKAVRMPTGKVIGLGMAVTEKPAGYVKGIATASEVGNFSTEEKHLPATWDNYNNDESFSLYDHDCDIGDGDKGKVKSDKQLDAQTKLILSSISDLKKGKISREDFESKTHINVIFAKKGDKHYLVNCSCGSIISKCRCNSKNKTIITLDAACAKCLAPIKNIANNISHSTKTCVNTEEDIMTIRSIEDITDENLTKINASVIADFIKKELTEKAKAWEIEKTQKDTELAEARKALNGINDIKNSLAQLQKEREDRVKLDSFNSRMSEIDASFDLDDEVRCALVDEVKAIASDEDFIKWKTRTDKILKAYKKSKSQKDSDEQAKEYRETNMNAKKAKAEKDAKKAKADMDDGDASSKANQISEDNKAPGQEAPVDANPGTDSDNQFVDRQGDKVNPTDGENNGEHPNQIAKDNWNKKVTGTANFSSKPNQRDSDGSGSAASVIEAAINNADKTGQHVVNTINTKTLTMKEKFAQAFASSVTVNGKKLADFKN